MDLNERDRRILIAVIDNYIQTGKPVSSRTIAKNFDFSVSPATIRNTMAELHTLGLLDQPHTSAGRIPTDEGFRYYVNHLVRLHRLSTKERESIKASMESYQCEQSSTLEEAGMTLSSLCHQASVVMQADADRVAFKHIQFVNIRDKDILGILVDETGSVHNKLLDVDFTASQSDLDQAANYLNYTFSGLSLSEVRQQLMDEIVREQVEYDKILSRAVNLGMKLLEKRMDAQITLLGEENFFEHPEFSKIDKLKAIYKAFHEKQFLVRLLDAAIRSRGIKVFIGSECSHDNCEEVGVVAVPFGPGTEPVGSLGVIGPRRMNYPKIIPLVDYTAKLLGEVLRDDRGD
ncbi:MAG: heat-inducible transcription repressor HrcA [Deltaproteobacteria bacterium]|nr:heat-inducible transcription repressor HrcA [Deltaproteobacteria bacterium]